MTFDFELDGVVGQFQALAASGLQKDPTVHFK